MIAISAKEAVISAMDGEEVFAVKREALTDIRAFDLDTIANGDLVFFMEKEELEEEREVPDTNYDPVDRVVELYKSHKSMEEIEEITGIALADVSRIVKKLKLGDERYKGEKIPSKGSAAIKSCMVGR